MPFDPLVASRFALLAMYAEDMRNAPTVAPGAIVPTLDARIAADGWSAKAYLVAKDAIFPRQAPIQLTSNLLYYGFVAQSTTDPSQWLVAVRGTDGLAEWIIDARFFYALNHPRGAGLQVEAGFWAIYESMALVDLAGATIDVDAAKAIAGLVGAGFVTVVGHSLGSALATYLSYDASVRLPGQVGAYLFASPRTGDSAWATAYDAVLQDRYRVVNYILDLVPRLPARPQYVDLPRVERLRPSTADAGIKVEVRSNHHVLCYCAMLSFATFQAASLDADQVEKACVLGNSATVPTQAKLLEAAVDGAERAGLSISGLFKAMLDFNIA